MVLWPAAHHDHQFALRLQFFDLVRFLSRQHFREDRIDAELFGDALRRRPVVARQHGDLDTLRAQLRDGRF